MPEFVEAENRMDFLAGWAAVRAWEPLPDEIARGVECSWRADEKGNAAKDLLKAEFYVHREIGRRQHQRASSEGVPGRVDAVHPRRRTDRYRRGAGVLRRVRDLPGAAPMNEICSVCGCGLRYGEDTTCGECLNWINYWNTLTTDEKRTAQATLDAYASEEDRL